MIKLRSIALTLAAAGAAMLLGGFAHAETFSFTSTSEVTSQVSIPLANGVMAGSAWIKGNSSRVSSKTGESTSTFVCASHTNRPSELYNLVNMCDVTEKDGGTFGILAGCNFLNKERTESNCIGGLFGKTGVYKDRRGTISWHIKQNAEGKAASTGAGVWNE